MLNKYGDLLEALHKTYNRGRAELKRNGVEEQDLQAEKSALTRLATQAVAGTDYEAKLEEIQREVNRLVSPQSE